MKRWMIWALLSFLWSLDGLFLLLNHRGRQGALIVGIGVFFALIGRIVARSDRPKSKPLPGAAKEP
jgi:hypothetical protein